MTKQPELSVRNFFAFGNAAAEQAQARRMAARRTPDDRRAPPARD